MNCEEEQTPGLREPAAKRPLSETALQRGDFYQPSGPRTGWGDLGQAIYLNYGFWAEGSERGASLWI